MVMVPMLRLSMVASYALIVLDPSLSAQMPQQFFIPPAVLITIPADFPLLNAYFELVAVLSSIRYDIDKEYTPKTMLRA